MIPTLTVDARQINAKFSRAGIPESVRKQLRAVIPDLTKRLGARVEARLDAGLKSHARLKVDKLMREDPTRIVGQVTTRWTGDAAKSFVPQILETGARAHPIYPRNAQALAFFWPVTGRNMVLKAVWHPGFGGIHYMQEAFKEMSGEIITSISRAVDAGVKAA